MKKILASILALLVLLSCVPATLYVLAVNEPQTRYTVLVLDISNKATFIGSSGDQIYVADTALSYVKKAASRFLDSISQASGDNYVAIVTYYSYANTLSDFSNDFTSLENKVNNLTPSGDQKSIDYGLERANELLQNISDENAIKNVVLFTTGMTNYGDYSYSGQYSEYTVGSNWYNMSTDIHLYAYANSAYVQANTLKENGVTVYTVGLFNTMEQMPEEGQNIVEFFKLTTKDLATSEDYYYPVDDPDNLVFTFDTIANDIVNPLKKIIFRYQSGSDYTATCYYTDEYFAQDAYVYNPSLATMSVSLAMSAYGSSQGGQTDYSNKSINAKQLMMDMDFAEEHIKTNQAFKEKPTTDSIGVIAGSKPITVNGENYTLIAVAIRGGGYESEWASNFTIGTNGQHEGFDAAKNNVISFLKSYVDTYGITGDVKFWITGYSRAAATANLVSGALDNGEFISNNINYSKKDIYAYCFETPAGALISEVKGRSEYNNIFNIINPNDPVPYVAPKAMGFCRYGIDFYLPTKESNPDDYAKLRDRMLAIYDNLDSTGTYIVDDFKMKKIQGLKNWGPFGKPMELNIVDDTANPYPQSLFLSNYVSIISTELLKNRNNYVSVYQDKIREICSIFFGCTQGQSDKLIQSISEQFSSGWKGLLASYIWNVGVNPFGTEDDALQIVSDWLKKAVKDAGITNYNEEIIDAAGKDLSDLVLALLSTHPNYATTAYMNIKGLGAAHYAELCYAWLASMDHYYTEDARIELSNGGYRIIRINCDVDVEVIDQDGNTVAVIQNEQPDSSLNSSFIYGVDEDGQKYIVLPNDSDYSISITGREDDLVNYSVSEYCASEGLYTRNVNFFDVPLKQGEKLTATVPSYSEDEIENDTPNGSDAVYTLRDPDNNLIECNSDTSGHAASESFNVNVVSSLPEYGIVLGSGTRQYGTFAQIEAVPSEGTEFIGWYQNDTLISEEIVYRFCVTENTEIVGKFNHTATKDVATNAEAEETAQTKKDNSIILWIALIIALFVLLIVCIIILICIKKKEKRNR